MWTAYYVRYQLLDASALAARLRIDRATRALFTPDAAAIQPATVVGHRARNWEPEPFCWLVVRFVQAALGRVDRLAEQTGKPPRGRSLEEWLARH